MGARRPALPAAQMRRLHRLAHRVLWTDPDAFEGHGLATPERLAAVLRGAADA